MRIYYFSMYRFWQFITATQTHSRSSWCGDLLRILSYWWSKRKRGTHSVVSQLFGDTHTLSHTTHETLMQSNFVNFTTKSNVKRFHTVFVSFLNLFIVKNIVIWPKGDNVGCRRGFWRNYWWHVPEVRQWRRKGNFQTDMNASEEWAVQR